MTITEIVGFMLQSGSIDNTFAAAASDDLAEGIRMHRIIQKNERERPNTDYADEVPLEVVWRLDDGSEWTLTGRCDGVLTQTRDAYVAHCFDAQSLHDAHNAVMHDGDVPRFDPDTHTSPQDLSVWRTLPYAPPSDDDVVVYTIDEIKPCQEIDDLTEPVSMSHVGQGLFYAYIHAHLNGYSTLRLRLTYYQRQTQRYKHLYVAYDKEAVYDFLYPIVEGYAQWLSVLQRHAALRDMSGATLGFPYGAFRKGQRALAGAVYRGIANSTRGYICAPTGTGKTMGVLFPAVKALCERKCERVFYLTAKTIGRSVAQRAMTDLHEAGACIKSVVISAKETACMLDKPSCNPETCSYADGHYDRNRDALIDCISNEYNLTRDVIHAYAKKHHICPFEFSLDLSLYCDVIICDYNYLFDPKVYLKRFFDESNGKPYAFLVDEAHNLPDRAREMYSAQLSRSQFDVIDDTYSVSLRDAARIIVEQFNEFEDGAVMDEQPSSFTNAVSAFAGVAYSFLLRRFDDTLLQLYFDVLSYTRISELYDENYRTYVKQDKADRFGGQAHRVGGVDDVTLRLYCVDVAPFIRRCTERGRSIVYFSATLIPNDYYIRMTGGEADDPYLAIPNPFPRENLCLSVADVATTYAARERTAPQVAQLLETFTAHEGNYMIFFPSYAYMRTVAQHYGAPFVMQSQRDGLSEREALLRRFADEDGVTAFCVLGGSFGEGVDIQGLRGVAVVTVGLPMVCIENDIIRDLFNDRGDDGFAVGYMYPGFNKVLQAAGRLIRSETDRGAVLLIDSRFSRADYAALFPRHYQGAWRVRSPGQLQYALDHFYHGGNT